MYRRPGALSGLPAAVTEIIPPTPATNEEAALTENASSSVTVGSVFRSFLVVTVCDQILRILMGGL